MNRQILEQVVFQFDVLAGIVADLDPEDPQVMSAASDMAEKLASMEIPVEISDDINRCLILINRIKSAGGDFQEDYTELCGLMDHIQKKFDSIVSDEVHGEDAGTEASIATDRSSDTVPQIELNEEDAAPFEASGAVMEDAPAQSVEDLIADVSSFIMNDHDVSDGLCIEDADEMRTQVDVIEELLPELASGAAHVFGVVSDLFVKIEKLETLPAEARRMALAASGSAKAASESEIEPMRAEATIRAAVLQLKKELDAVSGIGSVSSEDEDQDVRAGRDMLSGNFMDQTVVLIENLESDMLSFEGGSSEALSRILVTLHELRGRAESLGFDNVATFLSEIRSFLNSAGGAAGGDAFNLLLDARDLLSDFFGSISEGHDVEFDTTKANLLVDEMVRVIESLKGASQPAAPETKEAEAQAEEDGPPPPKVVVDVNNPEMVDFVTESKDYLRAAEVALIELEKDPGNREFINEIFRCFHNVKGISGFLNLPDVQELSHTAESLMDKARDGRIEFAGPVAAAAFDGLDMLREMVGRISAALAGESYNTPSGYSALLRRLKDPAAVAAPKTAAKKAAPEAKALSGGPAGSQPASVPSASQQQEKTVQTRSRSVSDGFIKVSTTRLDSLIDAVGELVIANAMVVQEPEIADTMNPRLARNVSLLGKITRELQELAMSMRMVTLRNTFHKMARVARDLSVKSSLPVEFTFSGEDTELDRNVVEEIGSPLVHMVRNAIDHGLESPEERANAGKPEKGSVHLSAYHEGGSVVIKVQDDGKGLDRAAIISKAKSVGLLVDDTDMSDKEVFQLIFNAGFSTAKEVTDISGRGVGMDVVKRSIENLRGRIDIESVSGKGTTFIIRLPLTMAIIDGMVVLVGGERYIIPTIAIVESLQPLNEQINTVVGKGEMLSVRGQLMPLFRLHRLFEIGNAIEDPTGALCVIVGGNGDSCALMVDNLVGQQQVVIKSLGRAFDRIDGVSGGAIMGDGRVALILDTAGLVRLAHGL